MMYVCFSNIDSKGYDGIRGKVFSQVRTFSDEIEQTMISYRACDMAYLVDADGVIDRKPTLTREHYIGVLCSWIEEKKEEKLYIRIPQPIDIFFLDFMAYLKDHDKRFVIEIPTYPYDGELVEGRIKVEDAIYREKLKQYVEFVAVSSSYEKIWGINCLRIYNGIDLLKYSLEKRNETNQITMVAMASTFVWWNGFDRLIEGLNAYTLNGEKVFVKLLMIGEGGDEYKYREMVEKYGLQERVTFLGLLSDARVNEVLSDADLAISCLGVHRKKMACVQPLRVPLYCAKGLPFVCDYDDDRFSLDYKYFYKVPADESPIDIEKLVDFFIGLKAEPDYKNRIRQYAIENFSWKRAMATVIDYFAS